MAEKKYDYARVPLSPGDRQILEKLVAAGRGKNIGAVLHMLAFDTAEENLQLKKVLKISEQVSSVHGEIIRKLRAQPSDFDLYESDLIKLDEKVLEMNALIAQLISVMIGEHEYGNSDIHSD